MKIHCVYIIRSVICPEQIYVGSSVNFCLRKWGHLNELKKNTHANKKLQNHFNKYGMNDLSFEILERVFDRKELVSREQYYIDHFNPYFNVLRFAYSGLGLIVSDETKAKISKGNSGRVFSKEHINKLKESHIGKKWSIESKEKFRKTLKSKGKKIHDKNRIKTPNGGRFVKGHKLSDESLAKRRISQTGKKHPERTLEWKGKQRESQKIAMTTERRSQISLSLTGKKQSKETVEKRIETRRINRLLKSA